MSLNMLDQTPFTRPGLDPVTTGPSNFAAANAFTNDFIGLSLQEEENLWGLSPISPGFPSGLPWTAKDQAFGNANLERDLKNSHVRNGQPTPPPYDDKKHSPDIYSLAECQLNASPPLHLDQPHRRSYDHFGADTSSGSNYHPKRRRTSKHYSIESDDQRQERAKREKFLERNRLAASKCRQKKKEHTMQLETRYKEQSDKKEKLMGEIARLRSEILGLKNEVLKHAQCGDEPIKLHLAQMVKKITYPDTGSEITDAADCASSSEAATTPVAQAAALSFGFDDQLQIEPAADALDQARRDSEASLMTESSYAFSADDSFDDLINV